MQIRLAGPQDDALRLSRLYAQSWKWAYRGMLPQEYLDAIPEDRWAFVLHTEARRSLLAVEGDEYVGTVPFGRSRDPAEDSGLWGEVYSAYLQPSHAGRGIGSRLLREAVGQLHKDGYAGVYLWVLEANLRARRFYEKNGFVCTGVRKEAVIGGTQVWELRYEQAGAVRMEEADAGKQYGKG